jgi:hypothetical protein
VVALSRHVPPWAEIVFVGYMSRDQIHQVIAREREMLAVQRRAAMARWQGITPNTKG